MSNESTVMILKLTNGEEILADCQDTPNAYVCKNAMEFMKSLDDSGQMNLGMVDYMPYAKDGFVVSKVAVVAFAIPADGMLKQYNQRFSKIQVASKSIITAP